MKLNALVVPLERGETVRRMLIELDLLHPGAKLHRQGDELYIPLKSLPDDALFPYRITVFDFEELPPKKTVEDLLGYTPAFDVIGNIAVLNTTSPNPVSEAEALMSTHRHLRGVFQSLAPLAGEFRTRVLRHLRGEQGTRTVHREHGISYELDIKDVYFTPRLATERLRIAEKITGGVVVDMFAGIGPFSLLIAKTHPRVRVVALDKNRHAVYYLRRNIQRNKVFNVNAMLADSASLPLRENMAEHVIMNLPHSAHRFLGEAMRIVKPEGIIYYYDIEPEEELYQRGIEALERGALQAGCSLEVVQRRKVRSYSPYQYNTCIEAKVYK